MLGFLRRFKGRLGLGFSLRRQGNVGFERNLRVDGELDLVVLLREEYWGLLNLETLVLLGVLNVEKIEGDYLVHLCDASEGYKEDFLVCMISC